MCMTVVHHLMYRNKNVCSAPENLDKEMDYFHQVHFQKNDPDCIIKD